MTYRALGCTGTAKYKEHIWGRSGNQDEEEFSNVARQRGGGGVWSRQLRRMSQLEGWDEGVVL